MVPADGGVIAPDFSARNDHSDEYRRFSDKILAAFSHAYAVGECDTATKLRDILAEHEAGKAAPGDRRRRFDPVAQADLQAIFVEARNRYNSISEKKCVSQKRIETALTEMKDAYKNWSQYQGHYRFIDLQQAPRDAPVDRLNHPRQNPYTVFRAGELLARTGGVAEWLKALVC